MGNTGTARAATLAAPLLPNLNGGNVPTHFVIRTGRRLQREKVPGVSREWVSTFVPLKMPLSGQGQIWSCRFVLSPNFISWARTS